MLGKCEATYVPNTHEMSIKPVRAARVTDTTGALLGEKTDVFEHPTQDTFDIHINLSTGFGRGSTGGRAGVYARSNKRVGGRGGERI